MRRTSLLATLLTLSRVSSPTMLSTQLRLTRLLMICLVAAPTTAQAIVVRVVADQQFEHRTGTIAIMPTDCRTSVNCAAIDRVLENHLNTFRKTGPLISSNQVSQAIRNLGNDEPSPASFEALMNKLGADTMIFPTISSYGPVEDHRVAKIIGKAQLGSARPLSSPTITIYAISKHRRVVMLGWSTGDSLFRSDGKVFARLFEAFSAHAFNGNYETIFPESPVNSATPKEEVVTAVPTTVKSTGTGFVVRPDGHVLTSNHVVRDASAVYVTCSGHDRMIAKLVGSSRRTDLALLQVANPTPQYLSLAPIRSGNLGDPVFTVGFPVTDLLGRDPKFTDGTISALSGFDDEKSFLQISVPIQPGNSGGPLVNDKGEVLGIVAATAAIMPFLRDTDALPQNINFAVKSEYARVLYDSPPAKSATTSRRDAIVRTQAALCFVEALQ